jgi:predicted Rossmann fold flavoprotein
MGELKVAIIGAGAAGYFAAIRCKELFPQYEVVIIEQSAKVLSKVRVSGGGRCNVTHACFQPARLSDFYPRGGKFLKKHFEYFGPEQTMNWFQRAGVELKIESDNRVFPVSDSSQSIIDALTNRAKELGIKLWLQSAVKSLKFSESKFIISTANNHQLSFDKVIIASGGHPKLASYQWLAELGHRIEPPVPSLFTFNMPNEPVKELMGVVVPNARVRIQGSKIQSNGPLLITHWGMSGPAILKLSAWAAKDLNRETYNFNIQVNWINQINEDIVRNDLRLLANSAPKAMIKNRIPFELPASFWEFILAKAEIDLEKPWGEVAQKELNRLINFLLNDVYEVKGKTTFKEEFVTCGGVSLHSISPKTLESKSCPGLYFAGEVLDIDGVTGGFNFQAAWTTGYIAGELKQ